MLAHRSKGLSLGCLVPSKSVCAEAGYQRMDRLWNKTTHLMAARKERERREGGREERKRKGWGERKILQRKALPIPHDWCLPSSHTQFLTLSNSGIIHHIVNSSRVGS